MKSERDSAIQKLFAKHNLGPLPSTPFSDEMALNCTSRLNARMVDLEKDLLDKKVKFVSIIFSYPVCWPLFHDLDVLILFWCFYG